MQGTTTMPGLMSVTDFVPAGTPWGSGYPHDDLPMFEAACASIRANPDPFTGLAMGRVYLPKPPKYFYCSRRLRPGCTIFMIGDGGGYLQTAAVTIRFPQGCSGILLDSYRTSISPYAPPGLHACDFSIIQGINLWGRGTQLFQDYTGSGQTVWSPHQIYTAGQYIAPTVFNGYNALVVQGGESGTIQPNWPASNTAYVDGIVFYDSGVSNPPPGAIPSGGNGECVYMLQMCFGIKLGGAYNRLDNVSVGGFCGSGLALYGNSQEPSDYGGGCIGWILDNVSSFGNDRYGLKVADTPLIGSGDVGAGTARNFKAGFNLVGGIRDESQVGNYYRDWHLENNLSTSQAFYINPGFTPGIVSGGYSEGVVPGYLGANVTIEDSYYTQGLTANTEAFIRKVHRCNWLSGAKGISSTLGVGFTIGQEHSAHGVSDTPGYNAAFSINVIRQPGGGFDSVSSAPTELYFFTYDNNSSVPRYGEFYLHTNFTPSTNFVYGWGLTTSVSPHGAGHYTLGTGGYFGVTTPVWPGYWWSHPTRSSVRYIMYDPSAYAQAVADGGNRTIGDRFDTPAASVGHQSFQVTRSGKATVVWQASKAYLVDAYSGGVTRVRPRAADTTQAWKLDTSFSSSGTTGSTEPSWPSSPSTGDTIMDTGGQIRWKYDGVCARYQPFGAVEGIAPTINVAGNANVTLLESDERFLASHLFVTGALTGNVSLILPTLAPSNANNTLYPTEFYRRWVKNDTSGAFTLTVRTSSGTGATIAQGQAAWVFFDGVDIVRE